MTLALSPWFSLILLLPLYSFSAAAESTFSIEDEADVHYKKQVPIYLQHELGDVSIQGWNQDLIRVKLKKSASTESEENAKDLFKKFALISLETPKMIELRVGTPQGTDLLTKLRNRQQKKNIRIDLEIKAPSSMPISILIGTDKKLKLSQWRGKINITGKNNAVELNKLRTNSPMNVNCMECSLSVNDSEFSGSILVSDQDISLSKCQAIPEPILIFTQKGKVTLDNTKGDYQIRSFAGDVQAKTHQGFLQIQSEAGKLQVEGLDGDLDAQTNTGDIRVNALKVKSQLQLKNKSGQIEIILPHLFAGEVNLQSIKGHVTSDFSIQRDQHKMGALYGPELKGKMIGNIGVGNDISVTASSEEGKIDLKQRELPQ